MRTPSRWARALGDPEVLIGALRDRLFVQRRPPTSTPRLVRCRRSSEIARVTRRPELALLGHEWRFGVTIGAADLTGAVAALQDLEVLATLMPSPYWRYTAAVRRAGLARLLGDYDGALHPRGDERASWPRAWCPSGRPWAWSSVSGSPRACCSGGTTTAPTPCSLRRSRPSGQVPVLFLQAHYAARRGPARRPGRQPAPARAVARPHHRRHPRARGPEHGQRPRPRRRPDRMARGGADPADAPCVPSPVGSLSATPARPTSPSITTWPASPFSPTTSTRPGPGRSRPSTWRAACGLRCSRPVRSSSSPPPPSGPATSGRRRRPETPPTRSPSPSA